MCGGGLGAGKSEGWAATWDRDLSPAGTAGMKKGQIVSICRQLKMTGLTAQGGREEAMPYPRFQLGDCGHEWQKLRKIISKLLHQEQCAKAAARMGWEIFL